MALKPSIHHSVIPQAVALHASYEFRDFVDLSRLTLPVYTVISYPGMRGESQSIVTSQSIAKALVRATKHVEPIVAVAHGFTAEALELLAAHGAVVVRRSDYFWSDASYAAIRT